MQRRLTQFSVLMVEDDTANVLRFQEIMLSSNAAQSAEFPQVTVGVCHSVAEAKTALQNGGFDLILLDINLPDAEDLQGLKILISHFPNVPIVVHSGIYSAKLAAEAIALGAQDYIVKGTMEQDDLVRTLVHAKIRHDALRRLHCLSGARA